VCAFHSHTCPTTFGNGDGATTEKGVVEVQTTFEYQTAKEGTERAAPLAFEYGITDKLSLLVEPVFYASIRPKLGRRANGLGDLEVTLSYLLRKKDGGDPRWQSPVN
jgi:hypothetical protein